MSLANTIQNAISSGMKAFDDLRKSCTFHSTGTITHDPTTSPPTESETGGTDYSNVLVIFTSYKLKDIDGEIIHSEDKKGLIVQSDYSFVAKESDYIVQDSVRWDIKNVSIDPADALWILQLRKHNA